MIGLGVTLSAIPVYLIFVMEKPYKIRPKFMERLSGMYVCVLIEGTSGVYVSL